MDCKTLPELFELWKKAHKNESEESCKKTFPKNENEGLPIYEEFKESFCIDGFLGENFNGVLFILKESNTSGERARENFFWFRDALNDDQSDAASKKACAHYQKQATKYLHKLIDNDYQLSKCAYMNLNKRGGYGRCNNTQLFNYVEEYKDKIKKEIEIINPKYIICCGATTVYDCILPIIEELKKDIIVYDCYHLCCLKTITKRKNK